MYSEISLKKKENFHNFCSPEMKSFSLSFFFFYIVKWNENILGTQKWYIIVVKNVWNVFLLISFFAHSHFVIEYKKN